MSPQNGCIAARLHTLLIIAQMNVDTVVARHTVSSLTLPTCPLTPVCADPTGRVDMREAGEQA